jgi:hypothetical protein
VSRLGPNAKAAHGEGGRRHRHRRDKAARSEPQWPARRRGVGGAWHLRRAAARVGSGQLSDSGGRCRAQSGCSKVMRSVERGRSGKGVRQSKRAGADRSLQGQARAARKGHVVQWRGMGQS